MLNAYYSRSTASRPMGKPSALHSLVAGLALCLLLTGPLNAGNVDEDCVSFNPDNLEIHPHGSGARLLDGRHAMMAFDSRSEAYAALEVIKHYGFNRSCYVGRPGPSVHYFLVDDQAPEGGIDGEDCLAFDADSIEVSRVQNSWKIVEGSRWLRDFGDAEDEARKTLDIIHNHGFTHNCYVDRPDPAMTYMRRDSTKATSSLRRPSIPLERRRDLQALAAAGSGASSAPEEDCVNFNPDNVQIKSSGNSAVLVDGNHRLFAFDNRREAINAYRVIRHYGIDQSCFVGRPNASMKYLLIDGEAPSGSFSREDCVTFDPDNIEATRVQGSWKIVDGGHWLKDFGNSRDEAQKALKILQHHGFTRSCFVDRPNPVVTYFRQ